MEKKIWHDAKTETPNNFDVAFIAVDKYGNELICRDSCLFTYKYGEVILDDEDEAYFYGDRETKVYDVDGPVFFGCKELFGYDESFCEYCIFKNVTKWAYNDDIDELLIKMSKEN
jgi:hypothetical protein